MTQPLTEHPQFDCDFCEDERVVFANASIDSWDRPEIVPCPKCAALDEAQS